MIYNLLFGFYENITNIYQNTIKKYFENKPQKSLVENNFFLLTEHFSFFSLGLYFFYNENWLWDIEKIWKSNLNFYIFIYYYLYITRYIVKTKMLTGKEKEYNSALTHHISTVSLLSFSFWRFHRIGIMIGIIHDISDLFLLNAKIFLKYYETFHEKYMKLSSYLFLFLFTISFFFTRIILNSYIISYVYKTMYISSYIFDIDLVLCFSLLFLNLGIQLFYQIMIIKFLFKLFTGGNPVDEKNIPYLKNKKE